MPLSRTLGCFHPLLNNAAMCIGELYLFESLLSILLGIYLGVELLDHTVILLELNVEG